MEHSGAPRVAGAGLEGETPVWSMREAEAGKHRALWAWEDFLRYPTGNGKVLWVLRK